MGFENRKGEKIFEGGRGNSRTKKMEKRWLIRKGFAESVTEIRIGRRYLGGGKFGKSS